MVARILVTPVPAFESGTKEELRRARRVLDQNLHALQNQINRAIAAGEIVSDGSITLAMLADEVLANSGDVSGTHPAHTVVGLRGKTLPAPSAGDDGRAITWDNGGDAFGYTDLFTDPLTTRGDIIRYGSGGTERLALGATNSVLSSDGTDVTYQTLSALIDAVMGSTRGSVLVRGASGWTILAPGTSGYFLQSQGAGADPAYAAASVSSILTTKGDIWGYDTGDARIPIGTDGYVLTADSTQTLGLKWAAAGGGYSDPLTTRGDMLRRGAAATERFAIGAANTLLASDGTDPDWSTLTALLDAALGSTRGSILYRGASGWTILAPGTSTYVLTSNGAGADPSYQAASGGSGSTLTEDQELAKRVFLTGQLTFQFKDQFGSTLTDSDGGLSTPSDTDLTQTTPNASYFTGGITKLRERGYPQYEYTTVTTTSNAAMHRPSNSFRGYYVGQPGIWALDFLFADSQDNSTNREFFMLWDGSTSGATSDTNIRAWIDGTYDGYAGASNIDGCAGIYQSPSATPVFKTGDGANSETTNLTGVDFLDGNWHDLALYHDGAGNWYCIVDGTLYGPHSTYVPYDNSMNALGDCLYPMGPGVSNDASSAPSGNFGWAKTYSFLAYLPSGGEGQDLLDVLSSI